MDKADKPVLVVGATGKQGGAAARHLLADGWQVRALVRDTHAAPASRLAAAGARLVRGDMEDTASLAAAMRDVYGVFSVQPTVGSPSTGAAFTANDEVRWGVNVAEAAHAAHVGHFVFSSVGGADRRTGVIPRNHDSKWRIEQHIQRLGLPATVLRPVSFMENFTGGYYLRNGTLSSALKAAVPQQIIAVHDVGAFAALAFAEPDRYLGQALEIAGDELTPVRIAAAISQAIGRPLPYMQIPIEQIRERNGHAAIAHEWFNEQGYRADIPALRALYPGLMDFDTWLAREDAAAIRSIATSSN
ncbi:NmrA/HSCARG family protein [Dactylosporangium fulvum]|uniref:NmrA/HSCARG family protein n=1 Tax=Dactylosporangium fulvum TaxID=53359 RepID=A0ABY5WAK3_9ACTN|nr:NmrA/HSCARG family protein [Dactylosporangium fulvum]UWP85723.1 NmrA/HSCARG family protein [Dactylosporangium fulvum]